LTHTVHQLCLTLSTPARERLMRCRVKASLDEINIGYATGNLYRRLHKSE